MYYVIVPHQGLHVDVGGASVAKGSIIKIGCRALLLLRLRVEARVEARVKVRVKLRLRLCI